MKTMNIYTAPAHSLLHEVEEILVRRAKKGDTAAFDQLCLEHYDALRKVALSRVHRMEDAEDAVMRAMMKAYTAISCFDESRPVRPWLSAIVGNCCTDILRRRRDEMGFPENFDDLHAGHEDVQKEIEAAWTGRAAAVAIAALPAKYAEALTLRVEQELSIEEIAERMHCPVGTIKSWLYRARALLEVSLRSALAN